MHKPTHGGMGRFSLGIKRHAEPLSTQARFIALNFKMAVHPYPRIRAPRNLANFVLLRESAFALTKSYFRAAQALSLP